MPHTRPRHKANRVLVVGDLIGTLQNLKINIRHPSQSRHLGRDVPI